MSNNATKADLKNATGVDTSKFPKSNVDKSDIDEQKNISSDLSSFKSKVDKFDIGKLETTPVDLSKLSNVVRNDVVKN